jgi:hypothetical protein
MKKTNAPKLNDEVNRWIKKTLEENSLFEVVQYFLQIEDDTYHLDRHLVDSPSDVPKKVRDQKDSIYIAAFDLCMKWAIDAKIYSGLTFSVPFVVVDDSWIKGEKNAPPPHVRLCISKSKAPLDDSVPITACPSRCIIYGLQNIASEKHFICFRIDDELNGRWMFRPELAQ